MFLCWCFLHYFPLLLLFPCGHFVQAVLFQIDAGSSPPVCFMLPNQIKGLLFQISPLLLNRDRNPQERLRFPLPPSLQARLLLSRKMSTSNFIKLGNMISHPPHTSPRPPFQTHFPFTANSHLPPPVGAPSPRYPPPRKPSQIPLCVLPTPPGAPPGFGFSFLCCVVLFLPPQQSPQFNLFDSSVGGSCLSGTALL